MVKVQFLNEIKFKEEFESRAIVVKLSDVQEEKNYEMLDRQIAEKLDQLFLKLGLDEMLCHQIYDWWPNHTRYIEISVHAIERRLIDSVQHLLQIKKFNDWRVHFNIYESLEADGDFVGPLTIYREKLLASTECKMLFTDNE